MSKYFLSNLLLASVFSLYSQEIHSEQVLDGNPISEFAEATSWRWHPPQKSQSENAVSAPLPEASVPVAAHCCPEPPPPCPIKPPDPCAITCPQTACSNDASHFQVGANYSYVHIKPKGIPSTKGNLGGLQALYEYQRPDRIYGGVTFAWRQGHTSGSSGGRSLLEFDTQERLGYSWGCCEKGRIFSLFSGLGYRHYGEKVTSSGSKVTFNYNELYVPVGFILNGQINAMFSMGLNFQWMPQVYPTVTIVPLKGARWILSTEIANFRAELPLTICVSKQSHLSVVLQPYFEYWRDGHTSAKTQLGTVLHIPGNTYLFGGVDVNLRYSF